MTESGKSELPRIIWIYWEQGLDNAPDLVRQCVESWQRLNPDWRLVVLDEASARAHVDMPALIGRNFDSLPIQRRSDILRLNLLARYGGVWADATCLCTRPLDAWIHDCMTAGFFAFRDPGRDRVMANWFMASLPGNHLTRSFCETHNAYWRTNRFPDMESGPGKTLVRLFRVAIGKREDRQRYWFSFFTRRVLRVYPYFVFHYLFAHHLRRDRESREIFESMPYFSAGPAMSLQRRTLGKERATAKQEGAGRTAPVLKLTWKKEMNFSDTVMQRHFGQ